MLDQLRYTDEQEIRFFATANDTFGQPPVSLKIQVGTVAGSTQKLNEDTFSVTALDNTLYAAVFDGTSSQRAIPALDKKTGAYFASHFLRDTLNNTSTDTPPKEMLLKLNQDLLSASQKIGGTLEDVHSLPSSTGSLVRISPDSDTIEVAHVADSFVAVFLKDGTSEMLSDDRNTAFDNKMYAIIKEIAQEKGVSNREAKSDPRLKQALFDMYIERNNNPNGKGCGLINGDPNVEKYIYTASRKLSDIQAILIGSDGLLPPGWDIYEESTRRKVREILESKGVEGIIRTKKETEDADPDWEIIRYKHSDDATGIYITIQ